MKISGNLSRLTFLVVCVSLFYTSNGQRRRNSPEFSKFAAMDLVRQSRVPGPQDLRDQKMVPSAKSVRKLKPVAAELRQIPLQPEGPPIYRPKAIPPRDFGRYDDNGNRLLKQKFNPEKRVPVPQYQDDQYQPVQPVRRLEKQRPSPIREQFDQEEPSRQERPVVPYPKPPSDSRKRVNSELEAIIDDAPPSAFNRKEDRGYLPVEEYKVVSGPAIQSPSNVNPAYVESPYGYQPPPPEQRDLEAAVKTGADAYGSVDPRGVYQQEDRLSFQIHGHDGPHSYRYGYDTGHGYNRQFRYEERDGKGYLKGRYGFFDKHGKLQVINYSADPYAGFHAEGAGVPEYPH